MTDRADSRERPPSSVSTFLTFLIAHVRGDTRFTLDQADEAATRLASCLAALSEEVWR